MKTIPAKIVEISDKVIASGHLLPKPQEALPGFYDDNWIEKRANELEAHKASAFIAEVENACKYDEPKFAVINPGINNYEIVPLGQSCRITVPVNGKCEIVELNT